MSMNFNNEEFHRFLRDMGVEMETRYQSDWKPGSLQEEPTVTMLQRSRSYQALYQVNLVQGIPQVRVVLPEKYGHLKFQIYLVQLSELHPLVDALKMLASHKGSDAFEEERDTAQWHLLHAMGEMMKDLFWAGIETTQFPPEITIEKLL